MDDLKPCPFCGGDDVLVWDNDGNYHNQRSVICDYTGFGCGAEGPVMDSEKEAIEAWNKRVKDNG